MRSLFVDFSKAFDRVDHNTLLKKMMAIGIHKPVIRWLFSFLKDRQQRAAFQIGLTSLEAWPRVHDLDL